VIIRTAVAFWLAAMMSLGAAATAAAAAPGPSAEEVIKKMRAAYAALASYSDKGTITTEEKPVGATMTIERSTFVTRFKHPKQFYFEFTKDPKVSNERYVIWCPGDIFSTWWSASQATEAYAQGEGQNAFAVGEYPTAGSALLVPPLLFGANNLHGPIVDLATAALTGPDSIDGRPAHVLSANLKANYWSDTTRATKIWVDTQTYLVIKIFEDTPTGSGSAIERVTATFAPVANPKLEAAEFSFSPPSSPQ
jgi:outer membrane lipoprotein-sorting protein